MSAHVAVLALTALLVVTGYVTVIRFLVALLVERHERREHDAALD